MNISFDRPDTKSILLVHKKVQDREETYAQHVKVRRNHICRYICTRGSRHNHRKHVYHFCFLDSENAPEANMLSSYQPCHGGYTCGNNRTHSPRHRKHSHNEGGGSNGRRQKNEKSFVCSSSSWFKYVSHFPRPYFPAHAVLRPLRHRVINTRVYICAIVIAWIAGLFIAVENLLAMYFPEVDRVYGTVTVHSFLFMCVLFICASYLTIHTRLQNSAPEIEIHNQRSTQQNLRLSRTFFIVAAISLVFWLPAVVVYILREFCSNGCFSPTMVAFVNCLHLTKFHGKSICILL